MAVEVAVPTDAKERAATATKTGAVAMIGIEEVTKAEVVVIARTEIAMSNNNKIDSKRILNKKIIKLKINLLINKIRNLTINKFHRMTRSKRMIRMN